jgi:hypothetical protein
MNREAAIGSSFSTAAVPARTIVRYIDTALSSVLEPLKLISCTSLKRSILCAIV